MTKSYFISSAHALIFKLFSSLPSFYNDVTSKLLYIGKWTGYRATKQIQAKIDGLRTGYRRATIKVAHLLKIDEKCPTYVKCTCLEIKILAQCLLFESYVTNNEIKLKSYAFENK